MGAGVRGSRESTGVREKHPGSSGERGWAAGEKEARARDDGALAAGKGWDGDGDAGGKRGEPRRRPRTTFFAVALCSLLQKKKPMAANPKRAGPTLGRPPPQNRPSAPAQPAHLEPLLPKRPRASTTAFPRARARPIAAAAIGIVGCSRVARGEPGRPRRPAQGVQGRHGSRRPWTAARLSEPSRARGRRASQRAAAMAPAHPPSGHRRLAGCLSVSAAGGPVSVFSNSPCSFLLSGLYILCTHAR